MQKLFFELIQVSLGTLDCVDRGPSNEEWYELYRLSKHHGLATTCYDGVVRLFDFGLRAPQDLSIDWMADTEVEDDSRQDIEPDISNTLRRMLYQRWQQRNGSSLYTGKGPQQRMVPAAALTATLLQAYEDFHRGQLRLCSVVHLFRLLQAADGPFPLYRDGSSVQQMLQTFGVWHFTQAMMWVAGTVCALDASRMLCPGDASRGRFLLDELTAERLTLVQRAKNRLYKLLMF